jgi:NAD(P)-dependent dehydrogenase (short-subunit alcohol dehydrogenase family)
VGGRAALVTGGSRGIGAETCRTLAARGVDVAFTYRNKSARADAVAGEVVARGARALAIRCDITDAAALQALGRALDGWAPALDLLVLNASGGLERDLLADDPDYAMRINRDAQLATLDTVLPRMTSGAAVVFVTSHWAHLYGEVPQLPEYEPVARSKRAGEDALRARIPQLSARGIRLAVVTGDLVEGTITARLLERRSPGLSEARTGAAVTAADVALAIADAALDPTLATGATIVVGGDLASVPRA